MSGKIYYIACPDTFRLKIGFTRGSVHARLKALQTGSPSELVMAAAHPGTQAQERELHKRFRAHRLHGEWFQMCEELFEHVCKVVWVEAAKCVKTGRPADEWVVLGLRMMNDDLGPLHQELAGLIQ